MKMKSKNSICKMEGLNFEGYIAKIIVDEFTKLKKEFEFLVDESPCDIKLRFCSEEVLIWDKIRAIREQLSRERIRKLLIDFEDKRNTQYCTASFMYRSTKSDLDDSLYVMRLEELSIDIHTDRLNTLIMNHLDILDLVIENIKFSLRHEFGHILDYMNQDGLPEGKFIEMEDRRNKELEGWYASVDGRERTMDDIRRYYQLESERLANIFANVDVEAKLKNEEMLSKIDHTKFKTTIAITSTHELIEEEES